MVNETELDYLGLLAILMLIVHVILWFRGGAKVGNKTHNQDGKATR